MISLNQIQKKLAEAIKRSGLTQVEIANRLDINQSNISFYLSGKKTPTLETFANLCDLLDLDANEVLCIEKKQI